jgi:hypothetical protein
MLRSGSQAEQVLRSANLPVFTVEPEAHLLVESATAKRLSCTPPNQGDLLPECSACLPDFPTPLTLHFGSDPAPQSDYDFGEACLQFAGVNWAGEKSTTLNHLL